MVDGCQYDIADLLITYGASAQLKDFVGKTALEYAQTTEMLRILSKSCKAEEWGTAGIITGEREKLAQSAANVSLEVSDRQPGLTSFTAASTSVKTFSSVSRSKPVGAGKIESFDEYLKRMKEKEGPNTSAVCPQSRNNESASRSAAAEPEQHPLNSAVASAQLNLNANSNINDDLVRIETQLTKSTKQLDILQEEDSKFEGTANLRSLNDDSGANNKSEDEGKDSHSDDKGEDTPEKDQEESPAENKENVIQECEQVSKKESVQTKSIAATPKLAVGTKRSVPALNLNEAPLIPRPQQQKAASLVYLNAEMQSSRSTERTWQGANQNYAKNSYEVTKEFITNSQTAASGNTSVMRAKNSAAELLEGEQVAVFRSQRNDIASYINDRKKIKLNKSDHKMVTDIYNELLSQMENYTRIGGDNCSLTEGNLDADNDNYQHFESMLNQVDKFHDNDIDDDLLDLDKELDKSSTVHPTVFGAGSVSHFIKSENRHPARPARSTIACCTTTTVPTQDPVTFRNPNMDPKPNEELEAWLEKLKLKQLGTTLARGGITSLEMLTKQVAALNYENAGVYLKAKGVDKLGHRDRIILAVEHEAGKFRSRLEGMMRNPQASRRVSAKPVSYFGLECCSKPPRMMPDFVNPPELRQWLREQNLDNVHHRFVTAGFDDYEWILMQMNSAHPLTERLLANEMGIAQPSIRSRILYKLQEGTERLLMRDRVRGVPGAGDCAEVRTGDTVRERVRDHGLQLCHILSI